MNDIVYLEPDAEITSVIDKIRKSQNDAIILVIPRGGTIAQSIINLKLLIRSAKEYSKGIALVTTDKIASNLASQLHISIFSKVSDAEKAIIKPVTNEEKPLRTDENSTAGIKVNTYRKYSLSNLNAKAEADEEMEEIEEDTEAEEPVETPGDDENIQFERREISHRVEEDESDDEDEEVIDKPSPIKVHDVGGRNGKVDVRLEKTNMKRGGSKKLFFAITAALAIIIIGAAAVYLGPKAEAVLVLKTRDVDEKIDVLVNRELPAGGTELVAQGKILDLEKEATKSFPTTGKKNVGEKAKGTVTISNLYNYQSTIKLIKGTKITSDGKNFLLENDATIPVAKASAVIENNLPVLKTVPGTVDVAVIAEQSGDTYNLAPRQYTVAGYAVSKIAADSKAAFSGGTNKEIKIVVDGDLKSAEESLKTETLELAKKELLENADKQNLKILESEISQEVVTQEASKKVNDEADSFDLTIKIKYFVLGFAESDIKKSVIAGVEKKIEAGEMIVNKEDSKITYAVSESNIDDGQMKLAATFKGKIGKKLETGAIKNSLKNKSASSAQTYLKSIEGIESETLNIWPSFWKMTPFLSSRINVKFDYAE